MDKCVHPENVTLKIAVDNQDMANFFQDFDNVIMVNNPNKGVVRPVYEMTKDFVGEPDDIMIVPSDDFYAPTNWDMYLKEQKFDGVLKVNDGHMNDIISIPILTYKAFLKMNRIIYHPAYDHMFCDKELHDTANELGICRTVDFSHPTWEHRHPIYGSRKKDKHDEMNNGNYPKGKDIYTKRRYMTLEERMKV
jgi:hypothetical protein